MILEEIKGKIYVKKQVDNIQVYKKLQALKDPSIPPIKKIENDLIFYEFIEGSTLRTLIEDGTPITSYDIFHLISLLISTLSNLHEHKIIHKDIKPENIIISNTGKVYLIDFGAARLEKEGSRDTHLLGTEYYASPEHYGYAQTSFKSDIYSLGKIIEELDKRQSFTDMITRCCAIDPANRYASYTEMKKALDRKANYFIYEADKSALFSTNPREESNENPFKETKSQTQFPENKNQSIFSKIYGYFEFSETLTLLIVGGILIIRILTMEVAAEDDMFLLWYVVFILLDTIDYFAFLIKFRKRKGKNRQIFIRKIIISLSAFMIVFIVSIILNTALR